LCPFDIRDRVQSGRKIMAEDELAGSCAFGDAPDVGDVGVQRGHPFQGCPGDAMPLEVAQVSDVMDEDVGALGEGDQVVVHRGVAGEHDGAVRGVETVRESRKGMAVCHSDGGYPDNSVVEDEDRSLQDALGLVDRDVDSPDERARVRHPGVQWHHVQMVGVAGQDALDQVGRAGSG
jgi:hypothetical protein